MGRMGLVNDILLLVRRYLVARVSPMTLPMIYNMGNNSFSQHTSRSRQETSGLA
jgi:hypothetical protein